MTDPALVLEIHRQDNSLFMSVYDHSEIAIPIRHYSNIRFHEQEIADITNDLYSSLSHQSIRPDAVSLAEKNIKKNGQLLWDYLLSPLVKEKILRSRTTDLLLFIDETLAGIPWELLFDGKDFLSLKWSMGRLLRTDSIPFTPKYRQQQEVIRMLVVADPTDDLEAAYHEGMQIKNQFDRNRKQVTIDFKSTAVETIYLKKNFADYDLVHFAGHCEYHRNNPERSGWVLKDGNFSTQDIMTLGASSDFPLLVFSNACHSAFEGHIPHEWNTAHANHCTLASAFLYSGVRHYVGTIRRIEDPASFLFAKSFYANLITGKTVGESLRCARITLVEECALESLHWLSYVLYGDPHFSLFQEKRSSEKTSQKLLWIKQRIKTIIVKRYAYAVGIVLCIGLIGYGVFLLNPSGAWQYQNVKSAYYRGDNQKVIQNASALISHFPNYLAAYPILADTFRRTADTQNALRYYYAYALESEKQNNLKHLANAYVSLGWFYHLQGNYDKAFEFYEKSLTKSRQSKDKFNEAQALRKMAVWHIDKKNYETAFGLLTKSSEINRLRIADPQYKYNLACDYFDFGLLFINKNDFISAREFYDKSRKLFESLHMVQELNDYYFNLGEICMFEKEYQRALAFYLKGLAIDQQQGNKENLPGDFNMIGELYLEMDDLDYAQSYFLKAKDIAAEIGADSELAAAYQNLASVDVKRGHKQKARANLRLAQEIYFRIDRSAYENIKKEYLALDSQDPAYK